MKIIFLAFLSLFSFSAFSQNSDSAREATEIKVRKMFSKIPALKYPELVPFFGDGKWGYLDKKTNKIIVQPFLYGPVFFTPLAQIYYQGEFINFLEDGTIAAEKPSQEQSFSQESAPASMDGYDNMVRSSDDGFKGFEVSNTGELLAYSDLYRYNRQGIPGWNIQVVKYQNEFYGIVKNLEGKAGIIDRQGVELKGFEFNYDEILLNSGTKDTLNFWVFAKKEATDNYSLISNKGEVKMKEEIFNYPLTSNDLFGFVNFEKADTTAILDRHLMQWLVKPQTKIKVSQIFYSAQAKAKGEIAAIRKQVSIYYLVEDGKNKYFVDLKGKKYLPRK